MIEGEYYLQGQHEMASGFLLRPGGEFQFFFSYGALDRHGSGKWELQGDRILLNGAAKPASDFTLVKSSNTGNGIVTVKMENTNPALLRHIYCSLSRGSEGSWSPMDDDGMVTFSEQQPATISLLLEFCAERFSTISISQPGNNEFTFRIEPSVMEVFFENFSLQHDNGTLLGAHPLLQGNSYVYEMQQVHPESDE
jgi:hypothetical protein